MTKINSTPTCVNSKLLRRFNQLHIQKIYSENPQFLIEKTKELIQEKIPKEFQWEKFFEYTNVMIVMSVDV